MNDNLYSMLYQTPN